MRENSKMVSTMVLVQFTSKTRIDLQAHLRMRQWRGMDATTIMGRLL